MRDTPPAAIDPASRPGRIPYSREPPDWIKELYEIRGEILSVNPGTDRAQAAEKRFADWCMEYIPVFPIARDVADPCISYNFV